MIKAIIFDLDGTLVQTEILKARSYADAVNRLTNGIVKIEQVLDVFKNYVGLSRHEVAAGLISLYTDFFVDQKLSNDDLIKLLIDTRLNIYEKMILNKDVLKEYFCEYNLGLLNAVYEDKFLTGLATMSQCEQADKVLKVLDVRDKFKYVITREEVMNGKPNPEIYLKMLEQLKVRPEETIVIEDSVTGIKAAQNADINVFAVTNSITKKSVHQSKVLPDRFIIDNPKLLRKQVYNFIESKKN